MYIMVIPSPCWEKAVPAAGSSTNPTACFPLPVALGKGAEPGLSLADVGRARWVRLVQNGGGAGAGVSQECWKRLLLVEIP